jgi:hypothetical protein
MTNMAEALRSTIPYTALNVTLSGVVRHPDSNTAEFTVQLGVHDLDWATTEDGRGYANLILAAVSVNGFGDILASKMERVTVWSKDAASHVETVTRVPLTIRIPRKTKTVRVLMETERGGRIGSAVLDQKTIDAAPIAPTPAPKLAPKRPDYVPSPAQ